MSDCPICVRSYSKYARMPVVCPHLDCGKKCCRSCLCSYLLTIDGGRCMFCNGVLTNEFIRQSCSHNYWNKDYYDHRVQIIYDREKRLLPSTQILAAAQLLRQDRDKRSLSRSSESCDLATSTQGNVVHADTNFLEHCPVKGCIGMITTDYNCSLCKAKLCPKCMTPLEAGHTCIPETVETIKAITRDVKPCPNCFCPISKVGGCDQMWCTQCHVSFSWERGTIEKDAITHNPHYTEWTREGSGGRNDLPSLSDIDCTCRRCGISITPHRRLVASTGLHGIAKNAIRFALNAPHILAVSYPLDMGTIYQKYRIQFLLGEIDTSMWINRISRLERKRDKNEQVRTIIEMLVTTIKDILVRFVSSTDVVEEEIVAELHIAYKKAEARVGSIKGIGRIASDLAALT